MNCQNCRTPLKLHSSLQDLDEAALELLIGSAGLSVDPSITPTRLPYAADRRELYDGAVKNAASPVFRRVIPVARQGFGSERAMAASTKAGRRDDPTMSFAVLTDSEVIPARQASDAKKDTYRRPEKDQAADRPLSDSSNPTQNFSNQVESSTRLFEILSSRSDIDHPICVECTELLLASLKDRLDVSTKERDAYISFLKTLNNSTPSPSEVSKAQASLASSKAAEAKAFAELQALEKEKASLDDEVAYLEAESLALDEEEEAFWRSRNAFVLEISAFRNERDALNAAYDQDAQQLERLRRTNVYNDALHITSDGTFATINGLRLGRLPPKHNVDWAEINAAWGYAALLIATVADKLGFSFRGYRIKPMGSVSRIEQEEYPSRHDSSSKDMQPSTARVQKSKVTILDLYSSGDLPLASAILHRRINNGMVAFLECLRQLCDFMESGTNGVTSSSSPKPRIGQDIASVGIGMRLPYRIKNDKIGSDEKGFVSIRLNVSNDAEWTDACKYTLTCCKYLLAAMGKIQDARG